MRIPMHMPEKNYKGPYALRPTGRTEDVSWGIIRSLMHKRERNFRIGRKDFVEPPGTKAEC